MYNVDLKILLEHGGRVEVVLGTQPLESVLGSELEGSLYSVYVYAIIHDKMP